MATLAVKDLTPTELVMNEDGEFVCPHEDAYIEKACCSGIDSDGNPSCGCHGQDDVICPAIDCTGIQNHEINALFKHIIGGYDD